MTGPAVLTEGRGRVLLITLNRPAAANAINAEMAGGLLAAIEHLDATAAFSAGVVTGAGGRFCAGMDLKAFSAGEDVGPFTALVQRGATKPLVAAIEGYALGGGLELALTCDLLVAAKGTKLGLPEVGVGLFAAAGGLLRLPARIGYGKAMEMALTADPITAEEAADRGLVERLAEPGAAIDVAMTLAERIVRNAPLAVAASKQLVRTACSETEADFWTLQAPIHERVFASVDGREGPAAFAERRPPNWTGA